MKIQPIVLLPRCGHQPGSLFVSKNILRHLPNWVLSFNYEYGSKETVATGKVQSYGRQQADRSACERSKLLFGCAESLQKHFCGTSDVTTGMSTIQIVLETERDRLSSYMPAGWMPHLFLIVQFMLNNGLTCLVAWCAERTWWDCSCVNSCYYMTLSCDVEI